MSATVSKNSVNIPAVPHSPDYIMVSTVYDPVSGRLTVNVTNTSNEDAMTILMHSQFLLSGYTAGAVRIDHDKKEVVYG